MLPLRLLLSLVLVVIVAYTGVVISHHGWNFVAVFFGDMARFGWAGQFNLDFMAMLMLAGLWVAWRHRFSAAGIGLALLACIGGAPFLCIYLLIASARSGGDVRTMLLGSRRLDP